MITLRPHQQDLITKTRQALTTNKSVLLYMAPGGGKTVVAAYMARGVQDKGKRAIFACHRDAILNQTAKTFDQFGIDYGYIAAGYPESDKSVYVASIDTLRKRLVDTDMIVVDECFPSGTLVDGKPIESLRPGDYVSSLSSHGSLELRKVIARKKSLPSSMASVRFGNEVVNCTDNHPFFSQRGWVAASSLTSKDMVLYYDHGKKQKDTELQPLQRRNIPKVVRKKALVVRAMFGGQASRNEKNRNCQMPYMQQRNYLLRQEAISAVRSRSGFLFRRMQAGGAWQKSCECSSELRQKFPLSPHERKKSNVKPCFCSKDEGHIEEDRSQAGRSRWEWSRYDRMRVNAFFANRTKAICGPHKNKKRQRLSYELQNRLGRCGIAVGCRGRWPQSFCFKKTTTRQKKRSIFNWVRVDGVEILKQASDGGFGELCPDGFVYNIQVEGNENYFANGVLVHNCHISGAKTIGDMICHYRDGGSYIIGLSGSPCRLDGKPLRAAFECMVMGPQPRWLIDNGYLSEYRAYAAKRYDLSGLHTRDGDYVQAELDERFNRPSIIGDAVDTWRQYADGLRTVVYAFSIKHSHAVVEAFNAAGIPAAHMDGNTPKKEQRRIIEAFADGGIKVLSSVEILTTGFDLSAQVGRDVPIEAVSLLRPTQSLALAVQMMGRGLRYKPYPAVILDHAGVIATHGLPCQDREWSLDGHVVSKKAGEGVIATCTCSECFAVFRPSYQCPFCEAVREIDGRKIDIKEGDLAEIDIIAARQAEIDAQTETERKAARRQQGMAQTLESMADIAASKGYAVGWLMKVCPTKGIRVDWRSANLALSEAKIRANS